MLGATIAIGASALTATPAHADTSPQPAVPAKAQSETRASEQRQQAAEAVAFAADQIGEPYGYGAEGPGSWDCSGLAGKAWAEAGVDLPRTTTQIYEAVDEKVSWKGAVQGDLLFFYEGRGHMGVYAGQGYMIHAPNSGENVKKIKLTEHYENNFNGAVRPGA